MLLLGGSSVVDGVVGLAEATAVVLFPLIVELDGPELDDSTVEETGNAVDDGVVTDGDTAGDAVVLGDCVVLASKEMVLETPGELLDEALDTAA